MNNADNWPLISRVYAEEFSELMSPSYAMHLFNHSGSGTKGREAEPMLETDGNEFDREMEGEDYKMRRAREAYENDSGVPATMNPFEAMDFVYQGLARELRMTVRTFSESEQRPVSWYGKKDFDPEKDKPRHLTLGFGDKGEVVLKKRPHSTTMDIPHKHMPEGFPATRFGLFDTSDSMRHNTNNGEEVGRTSVIPWGDKSKYHYGLLAWYGFLEYLKQNHLLNPRTIGLGNFSTVTTISHGLEEAKRNALSPQFGSTSIASDKLEDIFNGDGNLIFTISDGDVQNWGSIRDDFMGNARRHQYFHLQIGESSEMALDLENNGFVVVPIERAEDLAQRVIDLADKSYRSQLT